MNHCYPKTPFSDHNIVHFFERQFSKSGIDFKQIEQWLTIPPRFTTLRVNTSRKNVDEAIEQLKVIFANKCRRLSNTHYSISKHPIISDLIIIEVEGGFKCREVLPEGKEVIVDLRCGQSVLRGAEIYAAGVVGAPNSLKSDDKVAVFVDIDGKCLRGWKRRYEGRKVFLGNGVSFVSRRDLFSDCPNKGLAIELTDCLYPCPSLYGSKGALFYPQNLPSALCVHVLNPQPGEFVLDMCAAPGGKATHIATLMKGKGQLIAIDKSEARVSVMRDNFEKLGVEEGVKILSFDATLLLNESSENIPLKKCSFDKILVDAPCSGLGQRPQLTRDITIKALQSYPVTQKLLLKVAERLLKPGGILVYSTCSFTLHENEEVVDYILTNCPNLELKPQYPHLGGTGLKGDHKLTTEQLNLLQRFTNFDSYSVNDDTIGFFIAKFEKKLA
ncbi:putative methyltransferase NSUN6-like protein [Dinothrombium tinctorium]|uniref:Putative methyltransferase NSUN6-like protein n=1 Tax=Dinothrombium tinctorium TaxID=1965070 RepID=A0A3S4QIB8_9ACAR|nr:putative methyltransferase NSUN6-like protein [Dinothrombium tinctorium]RWS03887.1 putative methyltransferase NSUN6-like protein [Dinothrombium tinctorium]RWS04037.1 putative methyltransferase NSUN6-like protein [Dinothrombium tinctorium]